MLEREWQLAYEGTSYLWGGVDLVNNPFRRPLGVYNREAPEVTDTELITDDNARPRQDGIAFGQDFRGGRTWTFQFGVKGSSPANTRQLLAELEEAWRGDPVRMVPGRMAALTTYVGGQYRTIYGRPRRFAPNRANLHASEATAVATFDQMDDVFYGVEEQLRIDLRASLTGGFTVPFSFPLVISPTSEIAGAVTVAGTLPAWVQAEIHGPIVNPVVRQTNGWTLKLASTILAGQVVVLDSRPWLRQITSQPDGASRAGELVRSGPLREAKLEPGAHEISLSGTDPTGTAYVMFRWQTSHASMN